MLIMGDDILASALESITGERSDGSDATSDLDVLARRSAHVIDSANLSSNVLGGRARAFCVRLTPGTDRFTWGPGGDVFDPNVVYTPDVDLTDEQNAAARQAAMRNVLPPTYVRYWTWVDGEYERKVTPGGRLNTLDEWLNHDWLGTGGWPRLLYWERDLNHNQQTVFLFAPEADADYLLNLYAVVPVLDRVERGREYNLPQGVAAYLIALLAIDGCQPFNMAPRPDMYAALKSAERGLGNVPGRFRARATSPDWLNLDGRSGYAGYGFGRF